jgi:DNA segregation ATPase FtsK/SpoIIIE, S-DNA-T family
MQSTATPHDHRHHRAPNNAISSDVDGIVDMPNAFYESIATPVTACLQQLERWQTDARLTQERQSSSSSQHLETIASTIVDIDAATTGALSVAAVERILNDYSRLTRADSQAISHVHSLLNDYRRTHDALMALNAPYESIGQASMAMLVRGGTVLAAIVALIIPMIFVSFFSENVASLLLHGLVYLFILALLEPPIRSGVYGIRLRLLGANYTDSRDDLLAALADLREDCDAALGEAITQRNAVNSSLESDAQRQRSALVDDLVRDITTAVSTFTDRVKAETAEHLPAIADWHSDAWLSWSPSNRPPPFFRFGTLSNHSFARTAQTEIPGLHIAAELPALARFCNSRPLLIRTATDSRATAIGAIQSICARLLATIPPGQARFLLIDPVGLGQNVAGLLALGDFDESLVTSRPWSERDHIDARLRQLSEHVENVIHTYLRNDYASIEEYNSDAETIAEPFRIPVVFDFPVNFTEDSARRLVSLVQNGPRCGVFPIILQDTSKDLPHGFSIHDLLQFCEVVSYERDAWHWGDYTSPVELEGGDDSGSPVFALELDAPCPPNLLSRLVTAVGERANACMTVAVPLAQVLKRCGIDVNDQDGWWKIDGSTSAAFASAAESVEVPLGPKGAQQIQLLTLGRGTAHHALLVGRTGSGKTNLFHVIIASLALKYSPEEVQLYLVDFKQGVEFKVYANHSIPHARVIAIASEREFGLSVLQGLDDEMRRRSDVFRSQSAKDIVTYRLTSGVRLPRILLIVDEFQEFFREDDALARSAAMLLDRLVRQGRSFGIHILMGSQSLAGSWALGRSTLDQMQIRIALPCSEADSRLVLADDNPAARTLSRPGEAIYNASSGLVEGNQRFQVALFSDDEVKHVLTRLAEKHQGSERPIIFEGDQPARIEEAAWMVDWIAQAEWRGTRATNIFLGEPIAMSAPTSVALRTRGGANLLFLSREEEEALGLLAACLVQIAAQHHPEATRFYIMDCVTEEGATSLVDDLMDLIPHSIEVVRQGRRRILAMLSSLHTEVERRVEQEQGAQRWTGFLIIRGLHRARDLRADPNAGYSFADTDKATSPSSQLTTVLRDGPEVGIHTIAWCDTFLNLDRTLEPRTLVEFGNRIVGNMSQDDSLRLIDDPGAARLDRPHRMIKYDDDQAGVLEKFRPYGLPPTTWLENIAEALRRKSQTH